MYRIKIFFLLLSILFPFDGQGQEMRSYVVQRGETIESIAQEHDITVEELKSANQDMELFYTGLVIYIPVKAIQTSSTNSVETVGNYLKGTFNSYKNECNAAEQLFKVRNYKFLISD